MESAELLCVGQDLVELFQSLDQTSVLVGTLGSLLLLGLLGCLLSLLLLSLLGSFLSLLLLGLLACLLGYNFV